MSSRLTFDGVLAELRSDRDLERTHPRDGAREGMEQLWDAGYRLVVWTGRDDLEDVADWLDEERIPFDFINEDPDQPTESRKIVADVYLDDRAIDGRADWTDLIPAIFERHQHQGHNRTKHTVITGASGAGKTTLSNLLSKAVGQPVWKVDRDDLWMDSDDVVDNPERYQKDTKAYHKYRHLLKRLVRRALKRKEPSILEGCQFLVAPGTLRGHRVVLIDADEETVVHQRLQRDAAQGKLTAANREERIAKALDLYRKLQPAIERLKGFQGVEVLRPSEVEKWVQGFQPREKAWKGETLMDVAPQYVNPTLASRLEDPVSCRYTSGPLFSNLGVEREK